MPTWRRIRQHNSRRQSAGATTWTNRETDASPWPLQWIKQVSISRSSRGRKDHQDYQSTIAKRGCSLDTQAHPTWNHMNPITKHGWLLKPWMATCHHHRPNTLHLIELAAWYNRDRSNINRFKSIICHRQDRKPKVKILIGGGRLHFTYLRSNRASCHQH